jgi:hypothetical protein
MSTPASLVAAWSRGEVVLKDVLAVPRDALVAAQALAERCVVLGDAARAEVIYRGLSVLDPTDVVSAARLAQLALERGEPEVALAWATRTLALVPRDAALRALEARARTAITLGKT